jgi:hypothetical protein
VNLKRLADKAKQTIDARGGTERLKQDAERLKGIATGPGTAKEKAKAGGEALKQPAPPTGTSPAPPATPRASTEPEPERTQQASSRN